MFLKYFVNFIKNQATKSQFSVLSTFGDLSADEGLRRLDDHLLTRSYLAGYQLSLADVQTFEKLDHSRIAGVYIVPYFRETERDLISRIL